MSRRTVDERMFDVAMEKAAQAEVDTNDAWCRVVEAALARRAVSLEKTAGVGMPTSLSEALVHCQRVYKEAAALRDAARQLVHETLSKLA